MNVKSIATGDLNIRSGPGTEYEQIGSMVHGEIAVVAETDGWLPIVLEGDEESGESVGWVSGKYVQETTEEPVPAPVPAGAEKPWVKWARTKLGVKEVPGAGDNPEILTWDRLIAGLPASMIHDATPWCAIFVHAALFYGGVPEGHDIDSALAVDWLKAGTPVTVPQCGDIVVFDFGGGDHHVAIVLSVSGGMVHVIGGNQSDAVTLASYSTNYVMGYRRITP